MPAAREILETGCEPEYTVDDFGTVEYLSDGSVRIPVCAEWRGELRVEYYVRVQKEALARLGRRCMEIAAETHNADEFSDIRIKAAH